MEALSYILFLATVGQPIISMITFKNWSYIKALHRGFICQTTSHNLREDMPGWIRHSVLLIHNNDQFIYTYRTQYDGYRHLQTRLLKKTARKNKLINCHVIPWGQTLPILSEYNSRTIEKSPKNHSGHSLTNVPHLSIRLVKIDDLFMRYRAECLVILRTWLMWVEYLKEYLMRVGLW